MGKKLVISLFPVAAVLALSACSATASFGDNTKIGAQDADAAIDLVASSDKDLLVCKSTDLTDEPTVWGRYDFPNRNADAFTNWKKTVLMASNGKGDTSDDAARKVTDSNATKIKDCAAKNHLFHGTPAVDPKTKEVDQFHPILTRFDRPAAMAAAKAVAKATASQAKL